MHILMKCLIVKPAMGALLFLSLKHNCRTWDGILNWPYVIHEQAIGRQYITHYLCMTYMTVFLLWMCSMLVLHNAHVQKISIRH